MASAAELAIILSGKDTSRSAFRSATGNVKGLVKQVGLMAAGFIAAQVSLRAFDKVLRGTIGAAIDFESSFAGIRKTMNLTETEFGELAKANRELAKSIPISVNELNRLGEIAGQLGVRGVANVVKFEETVAKIAITTNLVSDQAALDFARIANIMQLPIDQVDRLASTVVGLGNNFEAQETEIVAFATRIAGAGAAVGLTTDQILALGTGFAALGVRSERGGTAVQKVLLAMQTASVTAGDELDTFTKVLGITADQFRNLAQNDPAELFLQFIAALARSGDQAVIALDALGLSDQRLVGAFLSAANSGDLFNDVIQQGSEFWRENNALNIEAEKRFKTTASQIQLATNNFNDLGITIGTVTLPAIVAASKGAVQLANAIAFAIDNIESVTLALILLTTPITGPVGIIAAITLLAFKWEEIFKQLPAPVQAAAIGVAGFIDDMVNSVISGLNKIISAINKFASEVDALPGIAFDARIAPITLTSNIAGELRAAIAPFQADINNLLKIGQLGLGDQTGEQVQDVFEGFEGLGDAADTAKAKTDILADGIIDLFEALEHGISISQAATLELERARAPEAAIAFRTAVEFEKLDRLLGPLGLQAQTATFRNALFTLGEEFKKAGETTLEFVTRLAQAAQDAVRAAFDRLFDRPTREQVEIEVQLARLERQRQLLTQGGRTPDELSPLLDPLDREIEALRQLLDLRQSEQRILQAQGDLADRTLLTDREQMEQARILIGQIALQSELLKDLNTAVGLETLARAAAVGALEDFSVALVAARDVIGSGRQLTAGQPAPNIAVNVTVDPQLSDVRNSILREVLARSDQALRAAGFGGSLISSGTFVPG